MAMALVKLVLPCPVLFPSLHGSKIHTLDGGSCDAIRASCTRASDSAYKPCGFNGRRGNERVASEEDSPDALIFEEGIFKDYKDEKDEEEEELGCTDDAEGLIPGIWRPLQMELGRTKKERKKEGLSQQLENAHRKKLHRRWTRGEIGYGDGLQGGQELGPIRIPLGDGPTIVGPGSEVQDSGPTVVGLDPEAQDNWPITIPLADGPTIVGLGSEVQDSGPTIMGPDPEALADGPSIIALDSTAPSQRATPRNPRLALSSVTMKDVEEKIRGMIFAEEEEQPLPDQELESLLTVEEKALLKRRGPDFDRVSSKKWVLLHTLATSGQTFLLNELLKRDIDINIVDEDGLTALQKAVLCRREVSVRQLLRAGADAEIHDKNGASLLHYAVEIGSTSMVKTLLRHGISLNSLDENGWSPLHLAVQSGREDIVKLLIFKGADKTLENKDGLTPLDLCLTFGRGFNAYAVAKALKKFPRAKPIYP